MPEAKENTQSRIAEELLQGPSLPQLEELREDRDDTGEGRRLSTPGKGSERRGRSSRLFRGFRLPTCADEPGGVPLPEEGTLETQH